jgi:predicted MPP superfamily phosphohydrolase
MPSFQNAHRVLTRRRFLAGAAVSAAAVSLYSGELERHALTTEHRTVKIRNLPASFHGFTIAQLSDFHYRDYNEPYFIQHAVQAVNRLNPDMVALTGDFITAHRIPESSSVFGDRIRSDDANDCAAILQGITCPLRFCSLGNHDAVDSKGVLAALRANHLAPLYNEHFAIDRGGDRLWVAGVADAYYDIPNLATTLPARKENEPVVLLGHEPDFADTVAHYGPVDLMLCGHTHGGQVRIPFMPALFLPAMGVRYVEGLFQVGNGMQLYVNRGLGTMHVPFRFNCPPELTQITLQPA